MLRFSKSVTSACAVSASAEEWLMKRSYFMIRSRRTAHVPGRHRRRRAISQYPSGFCNNESRRGCSKSSPSARRHAAKLDDVVFQRQRADATFVGQLLLGKSGKLFQELVEESRVRALSLKYDIVELGGVPPR